MELTRLISSLFKKRYPGAGEVKLFLTDVDGTLTDGGMYYTSQGDFMKKFDARDGMGLQLLQKHGIRVGIITSESTEIVATRARKLGLDYLCQGVKGHGKVIAAKKICDEMGISMDQVAFTGDDVNDLEMLQAVGHPACPADACLQVKKIKGIIIVPRPGGHGCIRYFADHILANS